MEKLRATEDDPTSRPLKKNALANHGLETATPRTGGDGINNLMIHNNTQQSATQLSMHPFGAKATHGRSDQAT